MGLTLVHFQKYWLLKYLHDLYLFTYLKALNKKIEIELIEFKKEIEEKFAKSRIK